MASAALEECLYHFFQYSHESGREGSLADEGWRAGQRLTPVELGCAQRSALCSERSCTEADRLLEMCSRLSKRSDEKLSESFKEASSCCKVRT